MYFLRSWKESVAVFLPKNFKLYLLVTIKNTMETYGNLIYYFWWLILLAFVFEVGCYYPECLLVGPVWEFVEASLTIALSFVLLMLVRPSVRSKGFFYFEQHARKTFIGFTLMYFAFDFIRARVGNGVLLLISRLYGQTIMHASLGQLASFIYQQSPFIMLPPFIFSVLFYFDSNGSIKSWFVSIVRGFIMFIYNFPFCLISVIGCFGLWHGLQWLSPNYGIYLFFSFIPFVVSYFRTMYVKRLHDQFSLYYPNE